MPDRRSALELACRGLLLAYLCWLPMPFGSVTERAQLPLVVGALAICAAAAFARAVAGVAAVMERRGARGLARRRRHSGGKPSALHRSADDDGAPLPSPRLHRHVSGRSAADAPA